MNTATSSTLSVTTRTLWPIVLLSTSLFVAAPSALARQHEQPKNENSKESAAQRLERAVLVEESEHDVARSVELYTRVARDDSASKELRAKAWLRCGKALKRVGKDDEAKKAFESAAGLEGEAAEEARRIVEGKSEDDARTKARVLDLLGRIANPFGGVKREELVNFQEFNDLVWIGEAAIQPIADDLAPPSRGIGPSRAAFLAFVLVEIGGERAAAALHRVLRDDDPLFQRSFLEWLYHATKLDREPVRAELLALLHQRDPRIRALALERLAPILRLDEVAALLHDENEYVRAAAVGELTKLADVGVRRGRTVRGNNDTGGQYPEIVVDALREAVGDSSKVVRSAVCAVLAKGIVLRSERGRSLFVDCLAREELFDQGDGWPMNAINNGPTTYDSPTPAAQLLDVARKIGPFPGPNGPTASKTPKQQAFLEFVRRCCVLDRPDKRAPMDRWRREERPALWQMMALGVTEIATWAQAYTWPDDAVQIADALADYGSISYMAGVLPKSVQDLSSEDKQRCTAALMRLLEKISTIGDLSQRAWEIHEVGSVLVALDTDDADRALLELAPRATTPLDYVVPILNRTRAPSLSLLVGLLVVDLGRDNTSETVMRQRSWIVRRLASDRSPELLGALPRAYELGIGTVGKELGSHNNGGELRGVQELLYKLTDDSPPQRKWAPSFDVDSIVSTFEACAAGNTNTFWLDVESSIDDVSREQRDPLRERLMKIVGARVLDCFVRETATRDRIVRTWLRRHGPAWEQFVVAHFDDAKTQPIILASLPAIPAELTDRVLALAPTLPDDAATNVATACSKSDDPRVRERVFDFLNHRSPTVRVFAVNLVSKQFRERFFEAVVPLTADADWTVRQGVMSALGETFDRRAIPLLVEGLRDGEIKVRERAKVALEKIQFYVENKERWTKLLEGSGLDASDAAAALLKQAAGTQPKATRVAAIESLGTLGVAETLPLLIQFMSDADADVAVAAKAAIDRVNRRAAEKDGTHKEMSSGH